MTGEHGGGGRVDGLAADRGAFGILLHNEWLKARRRLACWLAFGFFVSAIALEYGTRLLIGPEEAEVLRAAGREVPGLALPDIWTEIFSGSSPLVFAPLVLVLLTCAEFTWRTARQNVIDGLSKTEWFLGKVLLTALLALLFCALHVAIPFAVGLTQTDFGAETGALVPGWVFGAGAGLLVAVISALSSAFFVALAIRQSGASLAVWFIWIFPIELGALPAFVERFLPDLSEWVQYLPFNNASQLTEAALYISGGSEMGWHLFVAVAWTVLFIGTSFVWFRRRDL